MTKSPFSTETQARAHWNEMLARGATGDLLDLAQEWADKYDRSEAYLKGIFNVAVDAKFKWWKALYQEVSEHLNKLLEADATKCWIVTQYKVLPNNTQEEVTSWNFKQDEDGARKFFNEQFWKISQQPVGRYDMSTDHIQTRNPGYNVGVKVEYKEPV